MSTQSLNFAEVETLAREGGPTRCGQLVVAFNPEMLGGAHFSK